VVVLGAGGAARAVVCTLMDAGVPELRLINRTQDNAVKLGVAFTPKDGRRIAIERWDERSDALNGATLLVNTAALGMTGKAPLEIDLAKLPKTAVVDDIVYIPLETDLLARARTRGNTCVDGLGMLLHQGRMGFKAWFGKDVQVSAEQRRAVAGDLGA
jgi:shikimate dehydrogenase